VTTCSETDAPSTTARRHRAGSQWRLVSLAALGRNQSIDPAAVAQAAESLRMTLGSFRFVLDETLLDR
jgi:hypothetical protein